MECFMELKTRNVCVSLEYGGFHHSHVDGKEGKYSVDNIMGDHSTG